MSAILLLHLAATLYMTGLIWFVQVVHYPLFGAVGRSGFAGYEQAHTRLTGWVVGPPMVLELATAIALVVQSPSPLAWLGLALVALIWLSTACFQMPAHRRLLDGFDSGTHERLVRTNWIRTAAWTARSVLALSFV